MRAHGASNNQLSLRCIDTEFEVPIIDAGPHITGCCIVLDVTCDIGSVFINVRSEVIDADA
jgi:hypothetical protein